MDAKAVWTKVISKPLKNGANDVDSVGMKRLQVLMRYFSLRRMKSQKLDGKPIVDLPPKTSEVREISLVAEDQELYRKQFEAARDHFVNNEWGESTGKMFGDILLYILRLRQTCTHRNLNENPNWHLDLKHRRDLEMPLTSDEVLSIFNLFKEIGGDDDLCQSCGQVIDGKEKRGYMAPCKHL